jgi:hypothetical protein
MTWQFPEERRRFLAISKPRPWLAPAIFRIMLARSLIFKGSKLITLEKIVSLLTTLCFVSEAILAELRMTGTEYQVDISIKFMGNMNAFYLT